MKVVATHITWALGRQLNRAELAEIGTMKAAGVCALCCRTEQRLVFEHDHSLGIHAGRGMTCQMCNAGHMAGVDIGRYAIDLPTRTYLMRPWHMTRLGKHLPYDPRVHVSVNDLDADDRRQLDLISEIPGNGSWAIDKIRPAFGHPALAAPLTHGDVRSILRLRLMNQRGLFSHDIAEIGDRMSAFQRHHLDRVITHHTDKWAAIAADAA